MIKNLRLKTWTKQLKLIHIACFFIYSLCVEVIARDFQPIGTVNPSKYIPAQKQISKSRNGMVTTQHFIATRVGEKILSKGGNAYDAAIAVGFTLAVVLPRAGNIGGGGFMVMHDSVSNQNYSIDYREMAPDKSFTKMYLQEDGSFNKEKLSTFGYLASGVPGTVAGFWEVHQKFGSLDWELLLEDAIFYAENGFEITPYMGDMLIKYKEKLSYYEPTKKIFMEHNPNFTGSILVQKDLANTLKIIAKKGKDGFYKGEVAKKIAEQMQKNGGLITENDLITYKPKWRKPLISNYRNNKIITMGPPSSGGVHIIQMLNILENYNLKNMGHNTTEYINLLAEVMKYAYADRSKHLGDPDFFDVPVSEITNKQYAATIKSKIKIGESKPSSKILPGSFDDNESIETTHFSVADKNGNVVSSTYTLNSTFGSGVTIEGTGILMNNEMDDFSAAPGIPNQFGLLGATANEIQPKKRPLSSMTPTIVMKNDQL
ncbi:MAG: gamma-glutamyltransferase, partial [Proteobacteria bacterium]|nr:gamma-glutamyltransferase [Pseudomonadota bacterium]